MTNRRQWLLAACAVAAWPATAAIDGLRRPWPRQHRTPELRLPGMDGAEWRLASALGRPLLLNFWASWCEPCRSEMPALELLATRHEAQGLQVVAINFRETDAAVRRFVDATAFSLPVLRDRDGGAAKAWGVRSFPTTVAVNRSGQALFTVVGECDWASDTARQWVAELL